MKQSKVCTACNEEKPATKAFWHPNTNGRLGFRSTCKPCTNKDNREREKRSKDKWFNSKKNGYLKSHYGITLEEYNKMFSQQGFVCKICDSDKSGRKTSKFLCVDHCHKTGIVRGILCSTCNSIVGFVEKTKDFNKTILNLQKYLQK